MYRLTGDASAATRGGNRAERSAVVRRWVFANRANLFVFAAATAIGTARMLAWPPAMRQDQWVYTLSGQMLGRLQSPMLVVNHTNTTPKPLATLLGLLVSPLPPVRAWVAVIVLATAVLVAASFAYGRREGGPLGAIVAVAGLALIPSLPPALYGGEIDLVVAALLVLALISGPRVRVALMILLGLLRPLAWPLAGIAAFLAAGGSLPRRLCLGVAGMAAPVVVWMANDELLYGSPLAAYRVNQRINSQVVPESLVGAIHRVMHGVSAGAGILLVVAGLLGFGVAVVRRGWRKDPFPAVVFAGYLVVLVVTWMQMRYNGRYALPLVAFLPLGAAHLASLVPLPQRLRAATLPTAAIAAAILAAAALHMSLNSDGAHRAKLTDMALGSLPSVNHAIACGPVGIDVGRSRSVLTAVALAATTRRSISDFPYYPDLRGARTQIVGPYAHRWRAHTRYLVGKSWVPQSNSLGVLWTPPGCRNG